MAESVKVAFVGGFLGSGKTTLLIEVGKRLASEHGDCSSSVNFQMKKPTMTIAEIIHIKGKKSRMSPLDVRRSTAVSFSMVKMPAKL